MVKRANLRGRTLKRCDYLKDAKKLAKNRQRISHFLTKRKESTVTFSTGYGTGEIEAEDMAAIKASKYQSTIWDCRGEF